MKNSKYHDDKKTNEKSDYADFLEKQADAIFLNIERNILSRLDSIEHKVNVLQEQFCESSLQKIKSDMDTEIELEAQLRHAHETIHQYQVTLDKIHRSTSWRLTAPLRFVGAKEKNLKKFIKLFNKLREQYSITFLLRKSYQVLSREGLNGFLNQLRQQNALHTVSSNTVRGFAHINQNTTLSRNEQGIYSLSATKNSYVYVEPRWNESIDSDIRNFKLKPVFSIVVPLYNTTQILLDGVMRSVECQWYKNWELILVDDASPDPITKQALSKINNPQVKIILCDKNQGISGATNEGLKAAVGDFIVFMDHDDEITPDCLYELASCIENENPDFIYSDEDKLTESGLYIDPHFKPDWSPDTMMSTMFTCHVSCVRRSLLSEVGLLRGDFNGCQDWDFVLRVSEKTKKIAHIPKILYHWRIIPGSTAADIAAKSYILDASVNVRKDALRRRGLKGDVEPVKEVPGYFRVNYYPVGNPRVSIIIPSRDNFSVLRKCIESIIDSTQFENYEIILVDNGSKEEDTLKYLNSLENNSQIQVIYHDIPFNYSELNNVGVSHASGDFFLFLNDDVEVLQSDWISRMLGYAQLEHVGAVGVKLLYPGKKLVQHSGVMNLNAGPVHAHSKSGAENPGYFMRNLLEYNYFAVTGACLMIARDNFEKVVGFEESLPVAYNDVEFCAKLLKIGLYNVVCQGVQLIHHESLSRGHDNVDVKKIKRLKSDLKIFYSLHPDYYQNDPFYNINLHPNNVNFAIAY